MLPEKLLIGIDNGLDGGLVVFRPDRMAKPLDMLPMPVISVGGKKELDLSTLAEWLLRFSPANVVIEEAPVHAPSAAALRSLALNYGKITGLCHGMGLSAPHAADQRTWQRDMLGRKIPKGMTKELAARKVKEIAHPSVVFTSPKGRWLDGLVDAFLIAHWWANFSDHP